MDPDTALTTIRQIVQVAGMGMTRDHQADTFPELVESIDALDKWITKGGFLPKAWDHSEGG